MEEENLEFTAILKQFGLDVSYMVLQCKKNVDKNIKHLNNDLDNRRFCNGLSELFQELSTNTVLFSKNLEEKIRACGKQEDYKEIIQKLQGLSDNSNSRCSCGKHENSSVELQTSNTDTDVPLTGSTSRTCLQSVGGPELSQCGSVHIQDEVKDEEPATQLSNNPGSQESQSESGHSTDGSTATVIYDCNSVELAQYENDQSTSQIDKPGIFSQPTVPNSPTSENQDQRLQNDDLSNLTEDVAAKLKNFAQKNNVGEECQENRQQSNSARSSKAKLSSMDESSESDIEFVQNDRSTEKKRNDKAVINEDGKKSLDTESDATVEDLGESNFAKDSNSSQCSDLTADNLSPGGHLESVDLENVEDRPNEPSQQFSFSAEDIGILDTSTQKDNMNTLNENMEVTNIESIGESIFDKPTQAIIHEKANETHLFDQPTQINTKQTGVNKSSTIDNNDSIFDNMTQAIEKENLLTEEAMTQPVKRNSNQNPCSPEALSSEPAIVSEADFDKFTQELAATIRTDNVDTNKSKENGHESNNTEDIFSAETQAVTNTRDTPIRDNFDEETQVCLSKPDNHDATTNISKTTDSATNSSLINPTDGYGNRSEATSNELGAAPDDGDVSGSDTSDGTSNTKNPKQKLKEEDRKTLLRMIHKFYTHRKKERVRKSKSPEDSQSSSDEANVKKPVRKTPKKRDRKSSKDPKSSEKIGKSKNSKNLGKGKKYLFESDSASDFAKDNTAIEEDHSASETSNVNDIYDATTQKADIRELSNLRAEEADKLIESEEGILIKRKSVRPLTTDSDTRPDSDDSDLAAPFKRKTVRPLNSTQSDLDQETKEHEGGQAEERVPKRVLSPDSELESQKVAGSVEGNDPNLNNLKTQPVKKIKLSLDNSEGSGLDDNARNDFLDMLDEHAKDNHPASQSGSSLSKGQEKEKTSGDLSQFNMGDSDRDCLLDMLMEKEGECGSKKKDESMEVDEDNSVKLPSATDKENYLIDDCSSGGLSDQGDTIIDDVESEKDQPKCTKEKTPIEKSKKSFQLDETEKDELVKILHDHINEKDSDSTKDSSESDKEGDDEVGQKRKSPNEGNKKNQKRMKKDIGREELLELVKDFEEAVTNGKDSEADSVILEVLREENLEQEKSKDTGVWGIYKTMLQERGGDGGDHSGSDLSDTELNELEALLEREKRKKDERLRNSELRKQYGFAKELVVKLARADISGYDLGESKRCRKENKENKGNAADRLCNLSTLVKRKKQDKSNRSSRSNSVSSDDSIDSARSPISDKPTTKPRRRKDSDNFEVGFSYDEDSMEANPDTFSRDSSILRYVSDDEDDIMKALMDNIRDSSVERGDPSSDNSTSSDNSRKRAAKKRMEKREAAKLKRKGKESGEESKGSNTESGDNSSSSDEKEEKTKGVDLDSSDEEDFVGVRKSRPAWRCDPLLNGKVVSSSSSESNSDEGSVKEPKKRRRIRRKNIGSSSEDEEKGGKKSKVPKKGFIFSDTSDSCDSGEDLGPTKETTPQKPILITDDEDTPSKRSKGRRNIRAVLEEDDLAEATQKAHNEEKERVKRLQERDKAKENSQSMLTQFVDDENPLILDVSDDITIKIHPKITKRLKPHQRSGIQFMWDSCYESISQLKKNYKGSGCILAHCMGLGKTLQALGLIQTLFAFKDITKTKHVVVVCPLSTVSNWRNEYKLAYKHIRDSKVKLYTIEDKKAARERFEIITKWHRTGGVLVLGYECFGLCVNEQKLDKIKNNNRISKEKILEALVDPGPDLIICDEGHLLRNKQTQRSIALNKVKTRRRIVLTGTPLQNNLLEYYYMVNFVKPDLLGTEKEYKINFVNPISNGQFEDSTAGDIMFMKKRTHVLHKILTNTVQRVEDTELKQYLPKLIDQAVFIKLSDLQVNLYNTYLDFVNTKPVTLTKSGNVSHKSFLADVQILTYICSHPNLITTAEKNHKSKIKEQDVIEEMIDDAVEQKVFSRAGWYKGLLSPKGVKELEMGNKMKVAVSIVEEAIKNKDKVLIFAQSYAEMDTLEQFFVENLKFKKDKDYYRMDGTILPEVRTSMCDKFNDKNNSNIKVFILSIKVGGLGLNLTAANRVILMNVSWNPSYDTQSVFRAFRFGQTKAVFVYRLITTDTVEEKIYQRGVTKLAVAHRVVDKHQITRHYNAADIQEFYAARPTIQEDRPMPNVPEDRVLANLVLKHTFVYKWHEHQDLLANRPEEELDEQEKNAAWEEYNQKEIMPPPQNGHQFQHHMGQPGPSGMKLQYPFIDPQTKMPYINPNNLRSPAQPVGYIYNPDHNYFSPKNANPQPYLAVTPKMMPKMIPRPIFSDGKQGTNQAVPPQVSKPHGMNSSISLTPINAPVKPPNSTQNNSNVSNITLPKQPNQTASEKPNVGRFVGRQLPTNTHINKSLGINLVAQKTPQPIFKRLDPEVQRILDKQIRLSVEQSRQEQNQPQNPKNNNKVVQKSPEVQDSQNFISLPRVRLVETVTNVTSPVTSTSSAATISKPHQHSTSSTATISKPHRHAAPRYVQVVHNSKLIGPAPAPPSLPTQSKVQVYHNGKPIGLAPPPLLPTQQNKGQVYHRGKLLTPAPPPLLPTPQSKGQIYHRGKLLTPAPPPLLPTPQRPVFQKRKQITAPQSPKTVVRAVTSTPAGPRVEPSTKAKITPDKTTPADIVPSTSVSVVDLSQSDSPVKNGKKTLPQSPVWQQQVRQFMDHLHKLQASHASGNAELPTGTPGPNTASNTSPKTSNRVTNINSLPKTVQKQGKKPLIAARNLSELQQGGSVSPKNSNNVSKSPIVRLAGVLPSTSKTLHINEVPVTNISHSNKQPNPKIVKVPNGLQHSPTGTRIIISPKRVLIQGQQAPKPPVKIVTRATGNNSSSQKLTPSGWIGNISNAMAANQSPTVSMNQRNISKSTNDLAKQLPIKKGAKNGVATPKKDQVINRNNVPPSRANSLPTISVPQKPSKLDKENRSKRRPSLKSGNSPRVSASIDLSQEDPSAAGNYLSPQIVKTLKQKGVSIRNVDQDVIKLD